MDSLSDNEEILTNQDDDQDDSNHSDDTESEEEETGNTDNSSSEDESSEDDPGDVLVDNTIQMVDIEEPEPMSLADKVEHLHQQFPKLPSLMIKKVLQREDINEEMDAATCCLQEMNGVPGEPQRLQNEQRDRGPRKFQNKNYENKKTHQHPNSSSSLGDETNNSADQIDEPFTLEEKVKYLQENFKTVPPFVIRKVLNRPDVNEDLHIAKNCLTDMASMKGTVNVSPEQNRGQRGRGGSDQGRRECWGKGAGSKDEGMNYDEDPCSVGGGAEQPETKQEESKPNKNKKNRNRKKKQANQNQNQNQGNWEGPNRERDFQQQYGRGNPRGNSGTQGGYGVRFPQGYPWRNQMPGFAPMQQHQQYGGGPFPYQGVRQPFHGAERGRGNYYHGQMDQPPFPFPQSNFGVRNDGPRPYRGRRPRYNSRGRGGRGRADQRRVDLGTSKRDEAQNEAVGAVPSRSDPPGNGEPLEPNTIVLRGLNPDTTFDSIRNFIEARTQEEVMDVAKSDDNKNALITLKNMSDFNRAKQRVAGRPLDGSKLSIDRLPVSSSILVCGLSPKTTRDALEYYFSVPRIGGDVSDIELKEGQNRAIVTFENPEVIQKVLEPKTPHKLDNALLNVSKYYPLLESGASQKPSDGEGVPIGVDVNIMAFISTTSYMEDLKESLKRLGFELKYKSGDSIAYIVAEPGKEKSVAKQKGIETLTSFTQKFTQFSLTVAKKHWEAVMADAYELQHSVGKDKVLVVESQSQDELKIICHSSKSDDLKNKFSEQIKETQGSEAKKTYSNQTIDVDEEKLLLLKKINFIQNQLPKSEYPMLDFHFDEENGKATITGPKKQFAEAKIKLYQHLAKMNERHISLSKTITEMLGTEKGLKRIKQEMEKRKITAVFCMDEGEEDESVKTFVVGISSKDAEEAAELISGFTSEVKIKVEKENREILQSPKWGTLCEELKSTLDVHVRRNEYFDTWIAGFKDDVASAYDKVQKFLDKNSVGTESFICQDNGIRRYLLENKKDELVSITNVLAQYSIDVKAGEEGDEFSISGTKIGIDRARNALKQLVKFVITKEVAIQQPGLSKFFTREGDRLIKSVEQEHRCTIEPLTTNPKATSVSLNSSSYDDDDYAAAGHSRSQRAVATNLDTSSSEDSDDNDDVTGAYTGVSVSGTGSFINCGTVKISWKPGNIVTEQADILVGSVIGQLSKSFQVQKGVQGSALATGSFSVAPAMNLTNCRHVILTHCSSWQSGNSEQMLRSTVQQCLQQALQLNVTSIAFPVLGTAGLGFPKDMACRIMISEVYNVVNGWNASSCIKDIRFVVFNQDPQLVTAFQQEFAAYSGKATSLVSNPSNPGHSGFGNVTVNVLQGNLVQERTNAIVNVISENMNLQTAGAVCKAIAAAAAPSLQTECFNMGQQSAGSAVVTNAGGTLQCGKIIHVIPGQADKQHIQKCIENCLQVADNHGFQIISLPALGTGSYGMSDIDSANATFQALANVCPQLSNLKQVRVVIFQVQMLPTFQQTQQQYGVTSSSFAKPQKRASPSKPSIRKTSSGCKTLTTTTSSTSMRFLIIGKSNDNVSIAETSLIKGFSEACKTQKVENENVSKLSQRQRTTLTRKANQLDVIIKFEDKIQRIVVRGDADDVSVIINDIWTEIQERSKIETDSEQAKVLAKTVQWQFELNGVTIRFSKTANATIEKAHVNKDRRVTVEVKGERVVIDLVNSTGQGQYAGQQVSVSRTTVGAKGGEDISLPKDWSPMPTSNGKEVTVHLVPLLSGSKEYNDVLQQFQNTAGGRGQIVNIQRIQNPHLYQQYMVRKRKMDQDNAGLNNEKRLFHGTAEANLNDINKSNFNRSFGGKAHGTVYGNGVYFARDASYSLGYAQPSVYSNQKHMYLARVLVGRYTAGSRGLIVPPNNFDSVSNANGSGGSIFVTFYDAQCYPEYLITFQ